MIYNNDGEKFYPESMILSGKDSSIINWTIEGDWILLRTELVNTSELNYHRIDNFYYLENNNWVKKDEFVHPSDFIGGGGITVTPYSSVISSQYAIVSNMDNSEKGDHAGKIYVYVRNGNHWTLSQEIFESEPYPAESQFGYGISLSPNNEFLVVSSAKVGAYIYKLINDKFELIQKIDNFNCKYLNITNNELLLSSPTHDKKSFYLFKYINGIWTQKSIIRPPENYSDYFNWYFIDRDGETVIVGDIYARTNKIKREQHIFIRSQLEKALLIQYAKEKCMNLEVLILVIQVFIIILWNLLIV